MNHTTTEIIAKEGWKYIAISFIAFILFLILNFKLLAIIAFASFLFNIFLFRNSEREAPTTKGEILTSPIDGLIVDIEESENYNSVKIEHSFLQNHLLRTPIDMKIERITKRNGLFLDVRDKKALKLNEKVEIVANTEEGEIKITLLAGKWSRGIIFFDKKEFLAGNRFALMLDGIVELKFPKSFLLKVDLGDEVLARDSIIAIKENK